LRYNENRYAASRLALRALQTEALELAFSLSCASLIDCAESLQTAETRDGLARADWVGHALQRAEIEQKHGREGVRVSVELDRFIRSLRALVEACEVEA
jgi:hypothetical protein